MQCLPSPLIPSNAEVTCSAWHDRTGDARQEREPALLIPPGNTPGTESCVSDVIQRIIFFGAFSEYVIDVNLPGGAMLPDREETQFFLLRVGNC